MKALLADDDRVLIVLDVQMPGGTGIEALKKLKQSARTSLVPVIVLSGSLEPETTEPNERAG